MTGAIDTERDVTTLEERVQKLAGEKSALELVITLMNRMSESPGLTTTIENMLHAVADVIGGVNLILYYVRDGEIYSNDINGVCQVHPSISDPLVSRVFASQAPEEIQLPFENTRMTTEEFAHAYTWAVPLIVEAELVGVFKIECLHLSMGELPREINTFFNYAALALKNGILGHSRLQRAYDALSEEMRVRKRAEADLHVLNRELEERVLARTAQVQLANEQLHASEERFAAAFQHSPIAISIARADDLRLVDVNDAFLDFSGYTREEILGKVPSSLGLIQTGEALSAIVQQLRAGGEPPPFESAYRTRNGETGVNLHAIKAITIRGIVHLLAMSLDITDRKRSSEKANQLAAIVQSSEDAIIGKDLQGMITSWNPGAERIYGYREAEALGRPIAMLMPPDREDEGEEIIRRIRAGDHIEHYEAVRRTRSGGMLLMSLTMSPVRDADGKIIAVSTIARDITEKKRAEDAIRRSLREKDILLKEIHHRVKNNLQIISSLLNLQSSRYQDNGILKAFDESQRRVRTMAMVHEQLYRSENFASVDFGENLRRITMELASAYGRTGIRLDLNIEPVTLSIDSAIPCGLIANELLSNALKHAFPDGRDGTITITLRMIGAEMAQLAISDDGVGFPEGKRPSGTPTTLGMTLVTSLAEQIDGSLTCSPSPGCTFTLDIPLPSADPHPPAP
jgi:PAS domain S-box-containing protein